MKRGGGGAQEKTKLKGKMICERRETKREKTKENGTPIWQSSRRVRLEGEVERRLRILTFSSAK